MRLKDSKASLYIHTIKYMKLSQVYYRIRKNIGIACGIGVKINVETKKEHVIKPVQELDFDQEFLGRFIVSELMNDRVTFLHSPAIVEGEWEIKGKSLLWNYNLHYFEYLFSLLNEYQKNGNLHYLQKAESIITSWIHKNPCKYNSIGWAPYTISIRLTNWLSFYAMAEKDLSEAFKAEMRNSIIEQYEYLSKHLERDILGNHYFENLKALVLCSVFFEDRIMLETAYSALVKECREEILEDGVHFELSPMYHNIVLEGLLKTYVALEEYGYPALELKEFIQVMLDAAWSIEESLNRLPLFNDCGNNVAKSLNALCMAAENNLGIRPVFKSAFPASGFYIFRYNEWKLIVDAGKAGPEYIPGHAHCDALSFELFRNGSPILVNCGTFAYQSSKRNEFRRTMAHNTVMINGNEQSQLWGIFRLAERSSVKVIEVSNNHIIMELKDYLGNVVRRTITFGRKLVITDEANDAILTGFLHFLKKISVHLKCDQYINLKHSYSPEYGIIKPINAISYEGKNYIQAEILLEDLQG